MRSSTSSSDAASYRAPRRRWPAIWLQTILAAALVLAALEWVGRAHAGLEPSLEASPRLWSYWRDLASKPGEPGEPLVLLGTSRSQLAVDPLVLEHELGVPVVNLATNGSSPLPFLYDLAADEQFRGTIVCGFVHSTIFTRRTSWETKSQAYLTHFRQRAFTEPLENAIRFWFQQHLVLLLPQLEPLRLLRRIVQGKLPEPFYVQMRFDRWQRADYQMLHEVRRGALREVPDFLPEDEQRARFARIADAISTIESRGGKVLFVRHPSSGDMLDSEERYFPDDVTQSFLAATGARLIDFRSIEGATEIVLPDGTHLDYRDVASYTRNLANALKPELVK